MAEVIGLGASVIAIIQIADRIIGLCKFYIETVNNAPSDLRAILIETSTIKTILEGLQFLISCDPDLSATLNVLSGLDGPIEGCKSTITKIQGLFPSDYPPKPRGSGSKGGKIKSVMTVLAWPLKESKARKLLEEMIRYKATINLALTTESTHDIKDIKSKTRKIHDILTEDQRHDVYRWLQVTDPSPLHHRACKQYESGTGDWMLRSLDWKDWLDGKKRSVWIHGIPGAGKTVLASHLIENIKQFCEVSTTKKCTYVYYYCYFGHHQDEATPFLRWTVNWLCRQVDFVPSCLFKLYKAGGEPSLTELLDVLANILEMFDNIYIIIDAIDESTSGDDLLEIFRDFATNSRFQKIQLLTTSRQYVDIEGVMLEISVPVSLSNPLLEEDIRRYVQTQVNTNPKLRRWPLHLQAEAVEALSTKAKGMFRWAACQIDALQRLKGESKVIRNALANLPKTLNETYERIFLNIPSTDRIFVHQALQWIYCHTELHNNSISHSILLQAIERSSFGSTPSRQDYLYDVELLRELCGCLITVQPVYKDYDDRRCPRYSATFYGVERTVSFAHYTVWEFLDSARIFDTSAACFAVTKESVKLDFMRTILLETLNTKPNPLWEQESTSNHSPDVVDAFGEDFNLYCVASSILCLKFWGSAISEQDDISALAFSLLDPSNAHYSAFRTTVSHIEVSRGVFSSFEIYPSEQFWKMTWNTPPSNADSVVLISLLQLDATHELTRKFLRMISLTNVLQTPLDLVHEVWLVIGSDVNIQERWIFEGSIVDLFAHAAHNNPGSFRLLLEECVGYFDLSTALLSFIGSHVHNEMNCCKTYCPLSRLLYFGATADVPGYSIMPLQIAVACWDFEGVKLLLEAGADPNGTGDSDGIAWKQGSMLHRFNHLRDASPLHICRDSDCLPMCPTRAEREADIEKIEAILLQYGAEDFHRSPRT